MRCNRRFALFAACSLAIALVGCGGYTPSETPNNKREPQAIVAEHLRAVEAGEWDKASSMLSEDYTLKMKGMPFFISIDRAHAFDVHKARKTAFPDFKFNETMESVGTNGVKITVKLTGSIR